MNEHYKPMVESITLTGGFHNVAPITIRVKDGEISVGQYKRLSNHMCGIKGCICGWRGYDLSGVSAKRFGEMLDDAGYRAHMASYR